MNTSRVVIHLDLDCFYAQVEQKRLGIPWEQPAVVKQHDAMIAVNYAARAFGIKRGDRSEVCRMKCPHVTFMEVEMEHGKVSLARYRRASEQIFAVIKEVVGDVGVIERGSIDEAYLDVSRLVDARMQAEPAAAAARSVALDWSGLGVVFFPEIDGASAPPAVADDDDHVTRRLWHGAQISRQIRADLSQKLQYSASCGISVNK